MGSGRCLRRRWLALVLSKYSVFGGCHRKCCYKGRGWWIVGGGGGKRRNGELLLYWHGLQGRLRGKDR
jgi:hypothetical protein